MIEPTESETPETLDGFVDAMLAIARGGAHRPRARPLRARTAPAARASTRRAPRASPVLRWQPDEPSASLLSAARAGAARCAARGGEDRGFAEPDRPVSSDQERAEMGAQIDRAIRAQLPLIDDPVVLGFVHDVGKRSCATIEPQPFVYRFRVIANPR